MKLILNLNVLAILGPGFPENIHHPDCLSEEVQFSQLPFWHVTLDASFADQKLPICLLTHLKLPLNKWCKIMLMVCQLRSNWKAWSFLYFPWLHVTWQPPQLVSTQVDHGFQLRFDGAVKAHIDTSQCPKVPALNGEKKNLCHFHKILVNHRIPMTSSAMLLYLLRRLGILWSPKLPTRSQYQ